MEAGPLLGSVAPFIVMDMVNRHLGHCEFLGVRNFNYVVIMRADKKNFWWEHLVQVEGFSEISDAEGSLMKVKKLKSELSSVRCAALWGEPGITQR